LAEAESTWRGLIALEPGHATARTSLAYLLEKRGRLQQALEVLARTGSTEIDPHAPVILAKLARDDDAFDSLERISPQQLAAAARELAAVLVERNERSLARAALQHALARVSDPMSVLQLRTHLIETFEPEKYREIILREIRNLRRQAREDFARTAFYLSWLQQKASDLGIADFATAELESAWDNGKGATAAGVALLDRAFERRDSTVAFKLADQLAVRRDATSALLYNVLAKADERWPELAVRLQERLTRANPMDDQRVLGWARALQKSGQNDKAIEVLQTWGARAGIGETFAGQVAELYGDLGRSDLAEPLFSHAISQDLSGKNYSSLIAYAKFKQKAGDLRSARRLLASAFTYPGCRDYAALVEWITAAGRLSAIDDELVSFRLTPMQKLGTRKALFRKHCLAGDSKAALATLQEHPAIRDESTAPELQKLLTTTGEYQLGASLLESWLIQGERNDISVRNALAQIYSDWADADERSGKEPDLLKHLARAVELNPVSYPAVRKLALIYQRAGLVDQASGLLEQFIGMSDASPERTEARRLRETMVARQPGA
jgi:hypothetical protein